MFIGSESERETHTGDWKQEGRERLDYTPFVWLTGWL